MNREHNFRDFRRDTRKVQSELKHPNHQFGAMVKRSYSGHSMSDYMIHPYDNPYEEMKSKFVKELGNIHRQQRTTERDSMTQRYSDEVRKLIKAEPVFYVPPPTPPNYPLYPVAVNTNAQNEPSSYYRNEHQNTNQQHQSTAYQSHMSNYGQNAPTEIQQQPKSTSRPVYKHASSIHAHSQSLPRTNATHSQSYAYSQSNFNHIQPVIGSAGSVGANYGSLVINNVAPVNFIYCMNPGYVTPAAPTTLAAPVTIAHAPPPMTVHSSPSTSTTQTTMNVVEERDPSTSTAAEPMPVLAATAPSAPMISSTPSGSVLSNANSTRTVTASSSPINESTHIIDTEINKSPKLTTITEKIHTHEFTADLRSDFQNERDKFELMGNGKIMYADGRYYPSFCYPSFLHSTLHHILWSLKECSIDYSENILYHPNTFHILLNDYAALKYFPQLLWDILYNEQVRVTNFYIPPGDDQIDLYITLREYEEAEIIKMLMLNSSAHYYLTPLYQPTSINAMMVGFSPNEVDELTAYGMLGGNQKTKKEAEEKEKNDSMNMNRPKKVATFLRVSRVDEHMEQVASTSTTPAISPKSDHETNNEDLEVEKPLLPKSPTKTMVSDEFHDTVSTNLYSEEETNEGVNYPSVLMPERLEMTKINSNNFDDYKYAVLYPGKQKKLPLQRPGMNIKHSENLSDVFEGATKLSPPLSSPETTSNCSDTFGTTVGFNDQSVSPTKQSPPSYAQALKSRARYKTPLQTTPKSQNETTQRMTKGPIKPRQNRYKFSSFSSVESEEDYHLRFTDTISQRITPSEIIPPVTKAVDVEPTLVNSSIPPEYEFSNEKVEENLNFARLNAEKMTLEKTEKPPTPTSPHIDIEIEEDKSIDINIDVRNEQAPIYYSSADEFSDSEDDEMFAPWLCTSSVKHPVVETTVENDDSDFNENTTHGTKIITSTQENLDVIKTEVNQLHLNPGTASVNETIPVVTGTIEEEEKVIEEPTPSTSSLLSQFGLEKVFNLSIFGRRNNDSSKSK